MHGLSLGRLVVVFIRGPSGVGKSALVRGFLDGLPGEVLVLSGRCYERESVPYKAPDSLIDAMSRHLRRLTGPEVREVLPRDVASLTGVFPSLRRVGARSSPTPRSCVAAPTRRPASCSPGSATGGPWSSGSTTSSGATWTASRSSPRCSGRPTRPISCSCAATGARRRRAIRSSAGSGGTAGRMGSITAAWTSAPSRWPRRRAWPATGSAGSAPKGGRPRSPGSRAETRSSSPNSRGRRGPAGRAWRRRAASTGCSGRGRSGCRPVRWACCGRWRSSGGRCRRPSPARAPTSGATSDRSSGGSACRCPSPPAAPCSRSSSAGGSCDSGGSASGRGGRPRPRRPS